MPLLITADIFSGRENPSFVIGDDAARTLLPTLQENRATLASLHRPPVLGPRPACRSMIIQTSKGG
ncbi:MAG: hypothetical protein Q8S27_16110 [Hoeflea sp.]|nr:hypothetical protein [Hoeflea sp.]